MNWDAIGAIAEGVGALAVVATLAYLAIQVRYAKSTAADSNRLLRATGVREITLLQLQDDSVRGSAAKVFGIDAYFRDYAEKFGVEIVDAERADYIAQYYFWLHWGQFSTTKTDKDLDELKNIVANFYTMRPMKHSWHHSPFGKVLFEKEFVEFVEGIIGDDDA